MKIQLALDRLSIDHALEIARSCENEVDLFEIGTSLIKEFGMESIRAFRKVFPNKVLLADMKIIDNALYEANIAFLAGADVITVMGCSPTVTIELVARVAREKKKTYMIDLLATDKVQRKTLREKFKDAIFCLHISKDVQEKQQIVFNSEDISWQGYKVAVAGGINKETIKSIADKIAPEIFIVGGAITKVPKPQNIAKELRALININDEG